MSLIRPTTIPHDHAPASISPSSITLGYTPATSSIMSSNLILEPSSFSFSNNFSTAELFNTLSVFLSGRITSLVSNSVALIIASLTLS